MIDFSFVQKNILSEFLNLFGGAKKRKKKTYSKPKKKKRTVKKIKLKVLRYFQLGPEGSISITREQCKRCGPGVLLANHRDRLTCGRCRSTTSLINC